MLLVMVHFCFRFINTPFTLITFWMNARDRGKVDIVVVASKAIEVLMYVFEILFLIMPCVQTASEAKRTSHVICPLLNKYLPTNVRRQLEKSIQRLKLHNADFHPMGLFKFDLSIITSIAGFASTYLIIFVQQKASAKIYVDLNHNNTQNYSQT
ncbi:putative gustatory receptor 28b isoform X3 [Nilaparvata lugens]|nr:putative gustatory receptor 28b isoform X3 [Nilaparvata lugens]